MTISQRALIAAKLSNANLGRPKLNTQDCVFYDQERVATEFKVSKSSVERANKVLDSNNEELGKIFRRCKTTNKNILL